MENLKALWEQYDSKLQATPASNERLIRKIIEEKSIGRIGKILGYEYFGLAFVGLLVLILLVRWKTTAGNTEMLLAYLVLLPLLTGTMAWSAYKIRLLSSMDFAKSNVADLVRRVQGFRLLLMREKVWGFFVAMLLIMPATLIVAHGWTNGSSIVPHLGAYALKMGLALLVGIPVGLWMYRQLYFQPIGSILNSLQELKEFTGND